MNRTGHRLMSAVPAQRSQSAQFLICLSVPVGHYTCDYKSLGADAVKSKPLRPLVPFSSVDSSATVSAAHTEATTVARRGVACRACGADGWRLPKPQLHRVRTIGVVSP